MTDPREISMVYTNYKGETSTRRIVPGNIYWGKTKWHPEDQWLMKAFDLDKWESRDFVLKDCLFSTPNAETAAAISDSRDGVVVRAVSADDLFADCPADHKTEDTDLHRRIAALKD